MAQLNGSASPQAPAQQAVSEAGASLAPTLVPGGELLPLRPQTYADVKLFARIAVYAGMFKPARPYAKRDEQLSEFEFETSLAQATMAILQGLELGLPPMQAVQTIAVINGRCCVWGDALPALLWGNGFRIREWISGEGETMVAHCQVTRPDGAADERTFSVADAKQARLWDQRETFKAKGKDGEYSRQNDSPWFRFPKRMLAMRARGFAVRDIAADLMRGIYTREELVDAEREPIPTATPDPDPEKRAAEIIGDDMPEFDVVPAVAVAALPAPAGAEWVSELLAQFENAGDADEVLTAWDDYMDRGGLEGEDGARVSQAYMAALRRFDEEGE